MEFSFKTSLQHALQLIETLSSDQIARLNESIVFEGVPLSNSFHTKIITISIGDAINLLPH